VERPRFPGPGVIDDTGKFRPMTQAEKEDREWDEQLYGEAKALGSPISLRVHPVWKKRVLFFGNAHNSCLVEGKYVPGVVTKLCEEELKLKPFNVTGSINEMEVDQGNKTMGIDIGGA